MRKISVFIHVTVDGFFAMSTENEREAHPHALQKLICIARSRKLSRLKNRP